MTQESTEDLTTEIISDSDEIMNLLKRDEILLSEIDDYHIYPIADNDTPKLSSDRLEYSLSNALLTYNLLNLEEVKKMYSDIEIETNEDGVIELGFKSENIAYKFVEITSELSIIYRDDRTRYSMQFIADILKCLNEDKLIKIEDLYELKEEDIINIIENSKYRDIFDKWKKTKYVETSIEEPYDVYYIKQGAKIRYIDPLINGKRASLVNDKTKELIDKNLSFDMTKYVFIENIKF